MMNHNKDIEENIVDQVTEAAKNGLVITNCFVSYEDFSKLYKACGSKVTLVQSEEYGPGIQMTVYKQFMVTVFANLEVS